jgi:hypothetical protein
MALVLLIYDGLHPSVRSKLEKTLNRPIGGPYPRGTSWWARLNQPPGGVKDEEFSTTENTEDTEIG